MPVPLPDFKSNPMSTSAAIHQARRTWRRLFKAPWLNFTQAIERCRYHQLWSKQLLGEEANALIGRLVMEGGPLLVGRIGHTEGRIVGEWIFRSSRYGRMTRKEAHQYSGIFPVTPFLLSNFASVYARAIAQSDLLGFWQTTYQARLLTNYYSEIPLAPLSALEPYLHKSPWSAALAGRRVLVVHPFATSIQEQYRNRREILFANQAVLPDFDLHVLTPPQTLAPMTAGFNTWLEAMNNLSESVMEVEFDVALLGCGAYGLPLGAVIKRAGRQAIHLGGALQVLFGIRGRRWEQIGSVASLMNEHWIRPSSHETPESALLVDEGCYW